jgi:hypothetical protein
LPVSNTGFLDLSALTVGQTGVHPTVQVSYLGQTDASGGSATFVFTAAPPQLCTVVKAAGSCPTGLGVAPDSAFTSPISSLSATATVTDSNGLNESSTVGPLSQYVAKADCVDVPVTGYVYLLTDHGSPASGTTVYLFNSAGTQVLATTTTDSNGYYHFDNLYPNSYQVSYVASGPSGSDTTGASSLTCKAADYCPNPLPDLVIPYVTLTYTGPYSNNKPSIHPIFGWDTLQVAESPVESCQISMTGVDVTTGHTFGPLLSTSSGGVASFTHDFIDAGVYRIYLSTTSGQACMGIPDSTGVLVVRPNAVGRVLSLGAGTLNQSAPAPNFGLLFDGWSGYPCQYSTCQQDHVIWSQRGSWLFDGTVTEYWDSNRPEFIGHGTMYYWSGSGLSASWVQATATNGARFTLFTKGGFGTGRWVTGNGIASISATFSGTPINGSPAMPSFNWSLLQ